LQTLDFRKNASQVIESIQRDAQPVLISKMYSFQKTPLVTAVLKSGREFRNGTWIDLLPAEADSILSLNHDDPASVYRALFPNEKKKKHRLWRQFAGCVTDLHFDPGWSSFVNTQVKGRKKWLLVGPTASLQMQPIGVAVRHGASIAMEHLRHEDVFTVVTNPGETLFVPRFWFHHVWTLEDSLNVVRTIPMGCKGMTFEPSFRQILGATFTNPESEIGAMLAAYLPAPAQASRTLAALFDAPSTVDVSESRVTVTLRPRGTKRELLALSAVVRECNRLVARRVRRGGWKFRGDRIPPTVRVLLRLRPAA
jgi:hypothetical protein